ncbi:MAG: Crp/Fnr family transcriptional regulator [Gammaproteobacteria bacterium]|jgi:CRP-like cAMP-binding protein
MPVDNLKPEELRHHHLFAGLSDGQLARVLKTAHLIHLDEGQHLFECQQEARYFFMVHSGAVRLYLSAPDGTEKVVHIAARGDTFAEAITFMAAQVYPVNASALSASEIIAFSNSTFREILSESTDTCFRLMADMSAWLKKQLNEIDALTLQNATLRFSNYLLHQVPRGQLHDVEVTLIAPKHVIASRLSIQPESLSRILRNMQQAGLISVHSNTILIRDVEALETHTDLQLARTPGVNPCQQKS